MESAGYQLVCTDARATKCVSCHVFLVSFVVDGVMPMLPTEQDIAASKRYVRALRAEMDSQKSGQCLVLNPGSALDPSVCELVSCQHLSCHALWKLDVVCALYQSHTCHVHQLVETFNKFQGKSAIKCNSPQGT